MSGAPMFSFGQQLRWLEAVQDGSVLIPPFAVCEVTGFTTRSEGDLVTAGIVKVKRPTAANLFGCVINGPIAIAASSGSRGKVTYDSPTLALYDTGDTPAWGESWGTQANLFTLKFGNAGFRIAGGHADGAVFVEHHVPTGGFVGQTDGSGITARSGSTPGSGTVTIYRRSGGSLSSTGRTLTVYNVTDTAVAASTYVQCKFDMFGTPWVDVEEC